MLRLLSGARERYMHENRAGIVLTGFSLCDKFYISMRFVDPRSVGSVDRVIRWRRLSLKKFISLFQSLYASSGS